MQPRLKDLNTINAKLGVLKQDLQQAKDNIAQMSFYQSQLVHLKEALQKSEYKILMKEEVPLILEGISHLASQNGIKIDQIVPDKSSQELLLTNKDGKYYSFPISVQARAGYHDIGRFIDQLEKDKIFKTISRLTIVGNPADPIHHSLNLTIKAVILEKEEGSALRFHSGPILSEVEGSENRNDP